MIKPEVRKIFLERQRSMAPAERLAKSRQVAEVFFASFNLTRIKSVHCFIAIEKFNEIDTTTILNRFWKDEGQIETFVPRVNSETGGIDSVKFEPDTRLEQNFWGIYEPLHDELIPVGDLDMVLVPGLAFDARGYRVGYGKGFYDRFLIGCRPDCLKIGLSYFPPIEKIDDTYSGDVTVDYCVTPSGRFVLHGKH